MTLVHFTDNVASLSPLGCAGLLSAVERWCDRVESSVPRNIDGDSQSRLKRGDSLS